MWAAVVAADVAQRRRLPVATILGMAAARRKGATGNRLPERRHDTRDLLQPLHARPCPPARDRGEEAARVGMRRSVEQLQHGSLLDLAARVHDDDALTGLGH